MWLTLNCMACPKKHLLEQSVPLQPSQAGFEHSAWLGPQFRPALSTMGSQSNLRCQAFLQPSAPAKGAAERQAVSCILETGLRSGPLTAPRVFDA